MQLDYVPRYPEAKIAALIGSFVGGFVLIFVLSRLFKKTPLFKNKGGFSYKVFFPISLSWVLVTIFATSNMGINNALFWYIPPAVVLLIWDTVKEKKRAKSINNLSNAKGGENG